MKLNNKVFKVLFVLVMLLCLASCNNEEEAVHTHSWSKWETTKVATCEETGLLERNCECGEKDTVTLNKTAHTFDEGKVTKAATCAEAGTMVFTCSTCNKAVEQNIPTLEHKVVTKQAVPATCHTDGLTEGSYCETCNVVLVEQTTVKATGHAWGNPIVVKKATCEAEGSQKVICAVCKAVKEEKVARLEHLVLDVKKVDATCTEAGYLSTGHCSVCEKQVIEIETINPFGHNYVDGVCIRCKEVEDKVNGMKFKEINGEYYLSDIGEVTSISIVIPTMYNNNYVVGILDGALDNATYLNSIFLPATISSIEVGAFEGCSYLQTIMIDKNNEYYRTENNCLIDNITNELLVGAATANVPEGVVSIVSGAFKNRVGLTSISIPSTVTDIASDAFIGCTNILLIKVSEANEKYYSVDNTLIIKESQKVFLGCKNSKLPEGVVTIGSGAFSGCTSLTKVELPSTVTTVERGAFTGCVMVNKLVISKNLVEITGAFEGFTNLANITIDPENPKYEVKDGCIVEKGGKVLVLSNKDALIPEGIEIIGEGAFAGNILLTTITIPETVTVIGNRAFADCKNLKTIELSKSVTTIGDEAFAGCEKFEKIIIPDNVVSLGARSFAGCVNLQRIELSKYITKVGEEAFVDCDILVIACEAKKQPSGWANNWNPENRPTVWNMYIIN
ncbi:MAG: leucine-rich repeat domain-containing protein [Bacilli bacterium]|nr:leucine-rich repeat domain-containing protein [Bacilli bacterium]